MQVKRDVQKLLRRRNIIHTGFLLINKKESETFPLKSKGVNSWNFYFVGTRFKAS